MDENATTKGKGRLSQLILTLAQTGKVTISTEICPWRFRARRGNYIVKAIPSAEDCVVTFPRFSKSR